MQPLIIGYENVDVHRYMQEHDRDLDEDFESYEERRGEGMRKERAQQSAEHDQEEQTRSVSNFEEWPEEELYRCAEEAGIEGCDQMSRKDLINVLREHDI